jgi:hypothetical protein
MFSFTNGADVEFFVNDNNTKKLVQAKDIIKNTGIQAELDNSLSKHSKIEPDGVQLEIKPAETGCRDGINATISKMKEIIEAQMVHKSWGLMDKSFIKIDKDIFDQIPDKDKQLGCKPDYNIYTGQQNPIPENNGLNTRERTAGGHLHLSLPRAANFNIYFNDMDIWNKKYEENLWFKESSIQSLTLLNNPKKLQTRGQQTYGCIVPGTYGQVYVGKEKTLPRGKNLTVNHILEHFPDKVPHVTREQLSNLPKGKKIRIINLLDKLSVLTTVLQKRRGTEFSRYQKDLFITDQDAWGGTVSYINLEALNKMKIELEMININVAIEMDNDHNYLIRLLDFFVGIPTVLLDNPEQQRQRRKQYGMAGSYRTPDHGFEYRTLSNFWAFKPLYLYLVFGLARFAGWIACWDKLYDPSIGAVKKKNGYYLEYKDHKLDKNTEDSYFEKGLNRETILARKKLFEQVKTTVYNSEYDVRKAIDNADQQLAKDLFDNKIEPMMKKIFAICLQNFYFDFALIPPTYRSMGSYTSSKQDHNISQLTKENKRRIEKSFFLFRKIAMKDKKYAKYLSKGWRWTLDSIDDILCTGGFDKTLERGELQWKKHKFD